MKKSAIALVLSLFAIQVFANDEAAIERMTTEGKIAAAEALSLQNSGPSEAEVRTARMILDLPQASKSILLCKAGGPFSVAFESGNSLVFAEKRGMFGNSSKGYIEVVDLEGISPINLGQEKVFGTQVDYAKGLATESSMVFVSLPHRNSTIIVRVEKIYAIEKDSENKVVAIKNAQGETDVTLAVKSAEIQKGDDASLSQVLENFKTMSNTSECSRLR